MAELSPKFLQRAGTKDIETLQRLIPFKTLELSALTDRKGIYAMISNKQSRHQAVSKSSALDKLKQPAAPKPSRRKEAKEPER